MTFKNTVIFGDSYSTFKGHIPEGYAFYYPPTIPERPMIDDVADTWWWALMKETNSNLVRNDSWSGSTIGYTGYNGADTSTLSSFIYRVRVLEAEGFFKKNEIDTVFVFGATNDSWSDAPIGKNKYKNVKEEDLYFVLPGVCHLLENLKRLLPKANITFIINSELKDEITSGIKRACKHYKIKTIALENIDKKSGHPTVQGMKEIKKQILDSFK